MHGIEHIAAGNGFTLVAARDGLYGCGTTARGQLGIQGRDTLLSMTQIPLPRPAARITDLSAGMDHVLLLQDASVFATGLNTDGQLAKPAVIPYATQFTHVALPEGVLPTRVIAGGDTSMVLTSSGNVFVWGNTEYGQALQAATVDQLRTPTEVDVGISVVDACLGGSFLLFLDDCGTLHTAGYGAIGYEAPSTMLLRPLALPEKVTCIAAGLDYAAAATDAGNVYVWGIVHGEPGDTHLCPEHVAVPFDGTRPRRITDLACARGALLVLGEKHL
ncbi:hypothetical protein MVES1_003625 [Malassezia vespertilionis]|uniref:uncharacterized protein n=1 Tax=Malassezia vespertilionis TaxID=2020962 RepID=UPI0024B23A7B|nr:uncharacterized protein MVES1_003625 [Malassezia vespertilionis]WFD08253.1 hypothetical protein MVES1_003625 [Malassezia vespertilionis]